MPAAARLADPISHTNAFGGLIAGAIIGGGLALLTVGTGGLAAGAAVTAASVGEMLGSLSANLHVTGQIAPACSFNVSINRKPAARAHVDFVVCADHSGRQPVAQGSDSMFVNDQPAPAWGTVRRATR